MRWRSVAVVFGMGGIGCGSNVAQTCVGEACDTTSSGGPAESGDVTGGTSGSASASDDDSDDDDSGDDDDPGPICIVGAPGALSFCDLPWSCEQDDDCPASMICNDGTCDLPRACDVSDDCYRGEQCIDDVCRVWTCELDADCFGEGWCLDGTCVPTVGIAPCPIARGVAIESLALAPATGVADLAAMGVSSTVAVARGDGTVDLLALEGDTPVILATVSTSPADATRVAATTAFGSAVEPDLLTVGDALVLNRSSTDLATAIAIDTSDAVDVAAFGAGFAAITLHRDGAQAVLRGWSVAGDTLASTAESRTTDGATAIELMRDGVDLLVVSPTTATVHDGLGLNEIDTFTVSPEHPLIRGAMAAGVGGDVIALAMGGDSPGLWVQRESSSPVLAALATAPTQVVIADADGDSGLDLMLAHAGGVTWVRSIDADACAQDIALPEAITTLAFADLDGDGDLEVVAGGASSVHVVLPLE